ncbi:hypothetical protein ACWT_6866 [Actinoplanes sp. SE50]|uniref:hypothetical protein n=1 Tax=unclassified Actinoplanes TaxID=2626549 RepID=UPI00023ED506|nr:MULTISPECIES: hypothetical protein [unclassified Actinoplanes]AEV87877.1 hypothetical protein ACPL_6997 [Actinoplanes sp. SE50/110]ATO86281.1 hypothetical protein ACWT_6866 [Actinoplanes sp. SE50]SLM03696.1 hypothetical protein ACSP50_6995 [Actinoplanes sp. SE50/110]
MSPVRALPAEVGAVRALIADGFAELTGNGDVEQVWIRSACGRLAAADAVLAALLPRRSALTSMLVNTAVTAVVVTLCAALATATKAPPAAVAMFSALVLAAALHLATVLRRRGVPPDLPPLPDSPGSGLVAVPFALERARVQLVSAGLRHAGRANWHTPALHRAMTTDPVLARLADADLLLCQAIDCLERYLDDAGKDWP